MSQTQTERRLGKLKSLVRNDGYSEIIERSMRQAMPKEAFEIYGPVKVQKLEAVQAANVSTQFLLLSLCTQISEKL